jgi:hypothetical protein
MTCTEEQFRSILREEAADITPDSVPPLSLLDGLPTVKSRSLAGTTSPQWRRWLVPLSAAAAVTAIAVAGMVIAAGGRAPQPDSAAPFLWHGVPRYYFVVTTPAVGTPAEVIVRDTRSGATLTAAHSPRGCHFAQVSAAADDRTLALACVGGRLPRQAARLFVASFDPITDRLLVTAAHLPEIQHFLGIAMSQDGTRIAVVSVTDFFGRQAESTLRVYSLASGAVRTWSSAATVGGWMVDVPNVPSPRGLMWGPGPLLAFSYFSSADTQADSIRLLNTGAPPGDLVAASRPVVPTDLPDGDQLLGAAMAGNGASLATVLVRLRDGDALEFAEFSTASGRLLRRWAPAGSSGYGVLWSDFAGETLVAVKTLVAAAPTRHPSVTSVLGIVTGTRVTPLRRAPSSWLDIAF